MRGENSSADSNEAAALLLEEGKLSIPRGSRSLALSKEALRMRQKGCDRSHGSQLCQKAA